MVKVNVRFVNPDGSPVGSSPLDEVGTTDRYVPLSVRHGGRRTRLRWWLKGRRELLALRLAPWLRS